MFSRRKSEAKPHYTYVRVHSCRKTFIANAKLNAYLMCVIGLAFIGLGYGLIVKLSVLPSISAFIGILIAILVMLGVPDSGNILFKLLSYYAVYGTIMDKEFSTYLNIGFLIIVVYTIYMFINRLIEYYLKHSSKMIGLSYTIFRFGIDLSRNFSLFVLALAAAMLIFSYVVSNNIVSFVGVSREKLIFDNIISVVMAVLLVIFLKAFDVFLSSRFIPIGIKLYAVNFLTNKRERIEPCIEGSIELARDTGVLIELETIYHGHRIKQKEINNEAILRMIKENLSVSIDIDPIDNWKIYRPKRQGDKYIIYAEPLEQLESNLTISFQVLHEKEKINIKCRDYDIKAKGPSFIQSVSASVSLKGPGDEYIDEREALLEQLPINIQISEIIDKVLKYIDISRDAIKSITISMYKEMETGEEIIKIDPNKMLRYYLPRKYPIPDIINLVIDIKLMGIKVNIVIDDKFAVAQEVPVTISIGELIEKIASRIPKGFEGIKYIDINGDKYDINEVREFRINELISAKEQKFVTLRIYTRESVEQQSEGEAGQEQESIEEETST